MAYNFDTLKIRAGYDPLQHNNAVSVPIYQTVDTSTSRSRRHK